MTTMTSTPTVLRTRNHALTGARVLAGLLGTVQLAGAAFFLLIAREEAVWVGLWVDVPVVALMLTGMLLKVGLAVVPGLPAARRISMGFLAVLIGVAVTLVKIPVYDEPEGVLYLAFDAVLLAALLLAWRGTRAPALR
jgi:hypothetical protein